MSCRASRIALVAALAACAHPATTLPSNRAAPLLRCDGVGPPPAILPSASWSVDRLVAWSARAWMCVSDVHRVFGHDDETITTR